MKQLKALIFGLTIGVLLGLWFGVNLGRDKPLYSNPFTEPTTVKEKIGQALEKSGKALQDKVKP